MPMFVRRLRLTPRYSVKLARHALPVIVFVAELHGSIYGDTSGVPVPGNVRSFFVDRNFYSIFSKWFLQNEKSARRRRKHCALAVVRGSQKFRPAADPLPGAGRPKFIQLKTVTIFAYKPSLVTIDARNFELSW